jgi:CRISPR/Cas system CSM-associated protein Csm2 small subunit
MIFTITRGWHNRPGVAAVPIASQTRIKKKRLYSKIRKGRPRMRWLDDVESDLKKMKVKGWKEKHRDREEWRLVVEEAKAHPGL